MKTYAHTSSDRNREGIALIILLGMLSMILLLAEIFLRYTVFRTIP